MSFWLKMSERVGYGIGALLYGPAAAIEQRRIRSSRRAFAEWLGGERYTKLVAQPKRVRRLVERRADELSFLLECELAWDVDDARILVPLERRPAGLDVDDLRPAHFDGNITLRDDALVFEMSRLQTAEHWEAFAAVAVQVAAEVVRRSRGDGYR